MSAEVVGLAAAAAAAPTNRGHGGATGNCRHEAAPHAPKMGYGGGG